MECEERDRHAVANRIHDAQLPRVKTLEDFDFSKSPQVPAGRIRELAEGGYIERAEPIVLIGDGGPGKTHLATGLCLAACRQKRRARFTTAAALVNELGEAKQHHQVKPVMAKWMKHELIVLDELGYVPLAEIGTEFLFQVISDRAERAAWIVTTNLPFSEWTNVFPNPRLCRALLDRVTNRPHIIETGTESYRFLSTNVSSSLMHSWRGRATSPRARPTRTASCRLSSRSGASGRTPGPASAPNQLLARSTFAQRAQKRGTHGRPSRSQQRPARSSIPSPRRRRCVLE